MFDVVDLSIQNISDICGSNRLKVKALHSFETSAVGEEIARFLKLKYANSILI
jgi:hypothetical protein